MSKTFLVWLIVYFSGMFASFVKGPVFGLLTYMFTFYTQFSWIKGFWRGYSWSFYIGTALLISYFIKRNSRPKPLYQKMPQMKWLILMLINMLIVSPFALFPEENQKSVNQFINVIVIYFLIIKIIDCKLFYRAFIWLQIWGNWLFGFQATFGENKMVEGRLERVGGPGVREANQLGAHTLFILPFLGNMFFVGNRLEKYLTFLVAPFILHTIILCKSRGAFLGMLVIAILYLLALKKKFLPKAIVLSVIGIIGFTFLTGPTYWARMITVSSYEEDRSAMGRIDAWKGAVKMIADYPFGGGGSAWKFESPEYLDGERKAVHNTFLQVTTNWGIQGLMLFLFFLFGNFMELHKIRRRKGSEDDEFYYFESYAIQISIIGFFVAAMFVNRFTAESLYWYAALSSALSNIQQSHLIKLKEKKNDE